MTIYYLDSNGVVKIDEFDNVANLEAFEREMDEIHEVWSYDIEDIVAEVANINTKGCFNYEKEEKARKEKK